MFNYIRSDQLTKKATSSKAPMMPIEMKVNMPIEMQQIPQPDTGLTCIYPDMNMPPAMPCAHCMNCLHYTTCIQQLPVPTPALPMPDPSCDMSKNQDDMEVAYIKKMYSPLCQKIQKYVESELQEYDHELSPIYEMYPSAETINYMTNCIYTDMKAAMGNLIQEFESNPSRSPMGGSFYTLIHILLLNELYRKRMRRRLYGSKFGR